MEVLAVCPRLLPVNNDATLYRGFIGAGGCDYEIQIKLEQTGVTKNARIDCEWKLRELLRDHETLIKQRLEQSLSLATFLTEFTRIIECQVESRRQTNNLVPLPQFYALLLEEIKELGWNRLSYIDSSFKELHMTTIDEKKRSHTLKVRLHPRHPSEAPSYSCELPVAFNFNWTKTSHLSDLFAHFSDCVSRFREFWDVMDDIDSGTCVLEPERPARNALRRRIALGKSASLQIEVDPLHPQAIPDCRFLGSEPVIGPLKENFNSNIAAWCATGSLLKNLQTVLNIEFPSLKTSKKEDFISECGICYAYRLIDELPDQTCENSHCAQTFHKTCLSEWLRSLSSSRLSFNVLFGDCPYCKKPVTVKVGAQ